MHTDKPKAMDLFCGCGGLSLGLKSAGFQVLGAVDIDSLAVQTYKANHPDVFIWEKDIRKLDPTEVLKTIGLKTGELDLLAGCPPCQGFSSMRTLNGAISVEDDRNDLLMDFQRYVEVLRPRAIMMENVPGLAVDKRFRNFFDKMKRIGYLGQFDILDASNYAVPQRRKRLIYLAGYGMKISFAEEADKKVTVWDAIGKLPRPGNSGDPAHDISERRTEKVMKRIRNIPKDGGSRTDLPIDEQLECHKKCTGFKDVYGRMKKSDVAPTITGGCFNPSKGRFLHPIEDRAITMREAAMLQGFPQDYKFPIATNKSSLALMIGNALPPPFIEAHARSIASVLSSFMKSFYPAGE